MIDVQKRRQNYSGRQWTVFKHLLFRHDARPFFRERSTPTSWGDRPETSCAVP